MSAPAGYGYSYQQQPYQASNTQVQYANPQQPVASPSQQQPVPSPSYHPQPAPYQTVNKRGGNICNPCCCCKGSCNLRINCMAIAGILIALGILLCLQFIYFPLKEYQYCKKTFQTETGYGYGYYVAHKRCTEQMPLLDGILATLIIAILCSILAGIVLFIAIFVRKAVCAFVAGALLAVSALMTVIHSILFSMHMVEYLSVYPRWVQSLYNNESDIYGFEITPGLIWGLIMIYPLICIIQFGRQIRAGIDLDPVEGPPPVWQNNAVAAPTSYYAPPPAYGAYGTQSPAPPSSVENDSATDQKLQYNAPQA